MSPRNVVSSSSGAVAAFHRGVRRGCAAAIALAIAWAWGCADNGVAPPPPPPPPPGKPSVTLSPALDTLFFVDDTTRLVATVRDAGGAIVPSAALTWSSSNTAVATVNGGLVTALKNGAAAITAKALDVEATANMVVRQRGTSIALVSGENQGASVGLALDSLVLFAVKDATGHPAADVAVNFAPNASGGANPAQGTTDASGRVSTKWTLGSGAGAQELRATIIDAPAPAPTVALNATAFADLPDSMYVFAGNQQSELPSKSLPTRIAVKVVDKFGNGVPDVPITFSVTGGGGSLDATEALTDLDGVASAEWTLGLSLGAHTARAILPDSAVADVVNLPGSPANFSATAVTFALASVTPAAPVVGDTMRLTGTGFNPNAVANIVTVGGVAANVVAVSPTTLTAIVPSFGCAPEKDRTIEVTREATTLSLLARVKPSNPLNLAVGQSLIVSSPNDFCLQFLDVDNGTAKYLVGVTSTRRLNGELSFVMTAEDGVNAPPAPLITSLAAAPAASTRATAGATATTALARHRALREWEAAFFARRPRRPTLPSLTAAPGPIASAVGDVVEFRVPTITTDPCNASTTVSAKVIAENALVTVATDATLPVDPTSTTQIAQSLGLFTGRFANTFYPVATNFFGTPGDLDQNGRVRVLLSSAVNALGVPSFVTAVDLLDRATCPSSNVGEVVYMAIPATPTASDVVNILFNGAPGVAHDLTHLIQLSRRLSTGGVPLSAWIGEAQAELGTEIVGLALRGDAARADLGASVVSADGNATAWYQPRFDRLSRLFGWDGGTGKVSGAPERCSVFGFAGTSSPCGAEYASGAGWSFLRFVVDRIVANYQGGEAALQRDMIGLNAGQDPTALLESVAGADLSRLIVDWAMAMYVDGRVPAASAPGLQFQSWDLAGIYAALDPSRRLVPDGRSFTSFAKAVRVVGGGTAYTLITGDPGHRPLAVRVRDALGNAVGEEMRPRLWVVRIN